MGSFLNEVWDGIVRSGQVVCMLALAFHAQTCSSPQQVQGSNEDDGFRAIFDGTSLNDWYGDPTYWRVENESLIGTVTPETLLKSNSFLIWQGGQPGDFELKLEYRISQSGNSGINYRSAPFGHNPFALQGYQCDIDGQNKYTGQNYEEKKRTTLAYMGERVIIPSTIAYDTARGVRSNVKKNCWQTRDVVERIATKEELRAKVREEDWNHVHIIAKGSTLKHYVNGVLMSEVQDLDTLNAATKGYIGVQVHVGPPMTVAYRDIHIKELP